ncbi:MAG: LCP family protein [Oscillospiraceae bacterium]|nr:LCP family protein [Oscillospiraceae bacterium]
MSKKKRRGRAILITLLVLILVFIGAVIVLGMVRAMHYEAPVIEQAGQAVHAEPTPTPRPKPSPSAAAARPALTETLNLLLIGVDDVAGTGDEYRGNADGVIIATINPHTRELIFTSFMRDTRVRVQDRGYDKVTNVFHTGGAELLTEVLDQNFGIRPDYYAMFTYLDVVDIVDAVGGVDIDLSMEEIYFMEPKIRGVTSETHTNYEDNAISVDEAGLLTLNGVQAAAYCRIRPAEGGYDVGRTERTRNVISQVLVKAFQLPAAEMLQFANVFFEKIKTDIPDDVFLTLAMNASELRQYSQISDRIPIDGSYESGNTGSGYYVTPDYEVNKKHLQDSLYQGIHE